MVSGLDTLILSFVIPDFLRYMINLIWPDCKFLEGLFITLHTEHQYVFSPHYLLYISSGVDKENLFRNQDPLCLVIIFVFLAPMFDSGLILWGEISCWSVLEVKGFKVL